MPATCHESSWVYNMILQWVAISTKRGLYTCTIPSQARRSNGYPRKLVSSNHDLIHNLWLLFQNSNAVALLGHSLYLSGEFDAAKDYYQRAVEYVNPPSHINTVLLRLADIYMKQDEVTDDAILWWSVRLAHLILFSTCQPKTRISERVGILPRAFLGKESLYGKLVCCTEYSIIIINSNLINY